MAVLELGTVDLHHGARITKQRFGRRFHQARLAGPRGTEKQEIHDGSAGRRQSGFVNLKNARQAPHRAVLTHHPLPQGVLKVLHVRAL